VIVDASTPRHDTIPKVQLTLTDPLGRTAGRGAQGKRIPNSRYGKVTEIPSAPDASLVLAIEVCNALQGDYHIRIDEHGTDH
jgi:hypothetical protein